MGWLGVWWRQADHYTELSAHLQARGLATIARTSISLTATSLAVIALATIWSKTGPQGIVQLTCAVVAFVGVAIAGLFWALQWPTRVQAIRFTLLCNGSAALAALAQSDPVAGMAGCTTFATLAGYIALFHTAPLMTYNFAIAVLTGAVEATRLTASYNVITALCAFSLVLMVNLAVPFGIQVVVHVLGTDAVRAERDQLTGLLTRRAFRRRATARLEQSRDQLGHFVVTVIDLDRFKQLNDNYGHRTGDDALVSVSGALRDTTDDTAIICRSGGEEFVVADIWQPDEVEPRAQQLCDAIAALSFGITASIGTAGIHPAHRTGDSVDLLAELIAAADGAMYLAKRRGGNQTGHHRWPLDSFEIGESDHRNDGLTA